jgi:hypothetical protein
VGPQLEGSLVLGSELLAHELRPQPPGRAKLRDLHEEVHSWN